MYQLSPREKRNKVFVVGRKQFHNVKWRKLPFFQLPMLQPPNPERAAHGNPIAQIWYSRPDFQTSQKFFFYAAWSVEKESEAHFRKKQTSRFKW